MALTQIKSTLLAPQAVGWVHIATVTASDSATVVLEDGGSPDCVAAFDGTYNEVMIKLSNIQGANDDVTFNGTLEIGGSYLDTGYEYHVAKASSAGGATYGGQASTDDSSLQLTRNTGSTTGEHFNMTIYISSPDATDNSKTLYWIGGCWSKSADSQIIQGVGSHNTQTVLTGITFSYSSGNIASGIFSIYGLTQG